jgi:hypothetical protein
MRSVTGTVNKQTCAPTHTHTHSRSISTDCSYPLFFLLIWGVPIRTQDLKGQYITNDGPITQFLIKEYFSITIYKHTGQGYNCEEERK